MIKFSSSVEDIWQMADPGEGPGGPDPPPPLFLDQTEARRVEKYFFSKTALASSQGLDDRGPRYLEVWFRHCILRMLTHEF